MQKADRCPCSASPVSAAGSGSAAQPPAHRGVPLLLRNIPPSGGMSHRRLLLIAGCAAAAKALRLKISANPKEEGAVRGPEPPYGGGGAAVGEPIKGWRVGIDDKS